MTFKVGEQRSMLLVKSVIAALALTASGMALGADADLGVLSQSGFIINSTQPTYPANKAWKDYNAIMKDVDVFDRNIAAIEETICGSDQNKSVLIVGEPSDTYKYIFARFASKLAADGCKDLSHVEIDIGKIEAGHMYVGQVEEYWNENVRTPADNKNVVLYFSSLAYLMGIGSHSHDEDGIEKNYVSDFTAGRIRTIAYMDKFEYQYFSQSRLAYVMNSFGRKVVLDSVPSASVDKLVQSYLKVLYPGSVLAPTMANYLYRTIQYYQPNVYEPQRSMGVVKALVRGMGADGTETIEKTLNPLFESPHPYTASMELTRIINEPGAVGIALKFDSFKTAESSDRLVVSVGTDDVTAEAFYGDKGAFTTPFYPGNTLKLRFTTDSSDHGEGFKLSKILVKQTKSHTFTREDIRRAILEVAQVPSWLVDRNFSVVKNLRANLDSDVVGCEESKSDVVRLAKQGYVGGRTDEKPIGSVLFVGPTGTGKSFIAKRTADYLGEKLITIDMTSYRTPESFDRFVDVVSQNLMAYPFAIYLFEELDKADPQVLDRLYFMVDEGVFYDKYQRPIFSRGAFIMMTTNAGEQTLLTARRDDPSVRTKVDEELRKMFRPSFLNRFDAISLFFPFSDVEYRQLANVLMSKKTALLKQNFEWTLKTDAATLDFIATKGRSARFGARPMERLVENTITFGIAEYQLKYDPLDFGAELLVTKIAGGDNRFQIEANGKSLQYDVDTNINDGSLMNNSRARRPGFDFWVDRLAKVFAANRLFND